MRNEIDAAYQAARELADVMLEIATSLDDMPVRGATPETGDDEVDSKFAADVKRQWDIERIGYRNDLQTQTLALQACFDGIEAKFRPLNGLMEFSHCEIGQCEIAGYSSMCISGPLTQLALSLRNWSRQVQSCVTADDAFVIGTDLQRRFRVLQEGCPYSHETHNKVIARIGMEKSRLERDRVAFIEHGHADDPTGHNTPSQAPKKAKAKRGRRSTHETWEKRYDEYLEGLGATPALWYSPTEYAKVTFGQNNDGSRTRGMFKKIKDERESNHTRLR